MIGKTNIGPGPSLPLPIGGAAPFWRQANGLPVTPEGVVRSTLMVLAVLLNSGKDSFPEPYPANGRRSKSYPSSRRDKKDASNKMRLFYHGRDDNVRRFASHSDSRLRSWVALPAVLICIPTKAGQIRQSFSPAPQVQIPAILATIKEGGKPPSFIVGRDDRI
jgi:hypothetical protein